VLLSVVLGLRAEEEEEEEEEEEDNNNNNNYSEQELLLLGREAVMRTMAVLSAGRE
jgi:hypothetical protein